MYYSMVLKGIRKQANLASDVCDCYLKIDQKTRLERLSAALTSAYKFVFISQISIILDKESSDSFRLEYHRQYHSSPMHDVFPSPLYPVLQVQL